MNLIVDLGLEERQPDRVRVAVHLAPSEGTADLDGLALQLVSPAGKPIGTRLLLPIRGVIDQQLTLHSELRVLHELPLGCKVQATAWRDEAQVLACCPADPHQTLHAHLKGRGCCGWKRATERLRSLKIDEIQALARAFPWLDELLRARASSAVVLDDHSAEIEEVCSDLNLDDECAEWLKALLEEEE